VHPIATCIVEGKPVVGDSLHRIIIGLVADTATMVVGIAADIAQIAAVEQTRFHCCLREHFMQ
jgi:hypothetical protein